MLSTKRLYRYLSAEHALDALQQKRLKVGRLSELNDPLDCRPALKGFPPQANALAEKLFVDDYFSRFERALCILCFCKVIDDPVVWSHYADSHRGIALGFDFETADIGDPMIPPGHVISFDVQYPEDGKRVELDYIELEKLRKQAVGGEIVKLVSQAFISKARSWQYEQEVRIFASLVSCQMIGEHYYATKPMSRLREVILGVRCKVDAADIDRILMPRPLKSMKVYPSEVRIRRAKMDPANFAMIIEDENVDYALS